VSERTVFASTCLLEARDLHVSLGGHAVLDVPSLLVSKGEVLVMIGPNGSGKTTLLLTLSLLITPDSGTVLYDGVAIGNDADRLRLRRRHAVVFQEPLLLSSSVRDNVSLGLRLRGVSSDDTKTRTHRWLERFGIAGLAERQANKLSGGEAKRASLARAFVLEPDVLFLDEPFNGLDSPTRQALIEDFESVLRETGVTTIMVTHERNEALALAHGVIVLMDGKVRQAGRPSEVFSAPVDEQVANFVESGNVLDGVVSDQCGGIARIDIGGRQIEVVSKVDAGTKAAVSLPYDAVTIDLPRQGIQETSARNRVPGTVARLFSLGSQVRVTVDCGFSLVALITARSRDDMNLEIGTPVIVSFKASSVHVIPHLN
jgi:tungstate transport system ATP-binding protein